jgi:hypothetical protein
MNTLTKSPNRKAGPSMDPALMITRFSILPKLSCYSAGKLSHFHESAAANLNIYHKISVVSG